MRPKRKGQCLNSLPFTHIVFIDDEPIKKFRSLKEARWFILNKADAIIKKLEVPRQPKPWELVPEAPY